MRAWLIWLALALLIAVPVFAAAQSPLLAWRRPVYILAGMAGIIAMVMLLIQPLLITGALPGVAGRLARNWHRWTGIALVAAVAVHVAGLWITSPPDALDALLLRSPTPFSAWGVAAMWAVLTIAGMLFFGRRTLRWRRMHRALALVVVIGGVVHALLIQGTMEPWSKAVLCGAVLLAGLLALGRSRGVRTGRSPAKAPDSPR